MKKDAKITKSELVYQGSFLKIQRDHLLEPEGRASTVDYVLHPGAALIVPITDDDRFILEKQYRPALRREFIEFPAGKLDPGEDPEETARRELKEETGYTAREWTRLGRIHPCIGYSNEFIDLFVARGLVKGTADLDPGEHVEVFTVSRNEFHRMVLAGEVTDAKTLCGYYSFLAHQK
ncbi:MAG: NUDIX hydrolase [Bdellovibrionaceae bacterium]|nr:NUDIX hydrolase [Pseudobdellovibrionaceae bacterium]MBX3032540.1 NUDIX hydrolase [Pseudobdellovibrionaceae bacterium]